MKNVILYPFLLLAALGVARAQTNIYINDSAGDIYVYNSSDWTSLKVFNYATSALSGVSAPFSISSGPAANTLYLTLNNGQLATYNGDTLAVSVVGGSSLTGAALGEGRDGYLYMGSGTSLWRVDPTTGASVSLGSGAYTYSGDLAVNPLNLSLLYGAVNNAGSVWLASVDRATGAQTLIGDTGVAAIYGIGFASDGTLFGTGPAAGGGSIWSLNLGTGAATLQTTLGFEPRDMATQPLTVAETPIPEPSTWALIVGVTVGFVALYRRKTTPRDFAGRKC